jgi:hypothetical protein
MFFCFQFHSKFEFWWNIPEFFYQFMNICQHTKMKYTRTT